MSRQKAEAGPNVNKRKHSGGKLSGSISYYLSSAIQHGAENKKGN
jgi:hypothetical protein